MFGTHNNVTYNAATGQVALQGYTTYAPYLAPSAGFISLSAYDGDFCFNVTISSYQVAQ